MSRSRERPFRSLLSVEEVETFFERGYLCIPGPPELPQVRELISRYQLFLKEKTEDEKKRWCFAIDDPDDPDDGYVYKDGKKGRDHKSYFHWSKLLPQLLEGRGVRLTHHDKESLSLNSAVHRASVRVVRRVAQSLDRYCPKRTWYGPGLEEEFQTCESHPVHFSRSKLRIVWYPAGVRQYRASIHRDRSFLTVHWYGSGGRFFICDDEQGRGKKYIEPNRSQVLIFPGLKAERMTNGRLRALWHGSEADAHSERSAVVFFAHINDTSLQHSRATT